MLRKIVTDWHKSFSLLFSGRFKAKDIGIQICGCYCEQMSPLASKGNGTSRPTLTPGVRLHTTTGLQRGKRWWWWWGGSINKWGLYEPTLTLLFPSLQLSSKNICLLFLGHPPFTSVLASPWPILSIVVDVMTKNKQCEGVRLPFVWAGRSPSPLRRGRISPDEHSHFLLLLTAPDRYANTNHCVGGGSDVKWSWQTHFVSWLSSWAHCPFTSFFTVWMTCQRNFITSWQETWYTEVRVCPVSVPWLRSISQGHRSNPSKDWTCCSRTTD